MQLTLDSYIIDPVIETPVGAPTDEQLYTTVIGQTYSIEITGGPWNDGSADRTDVAVSWDGVTWTPFTEMMTECSNQNSSGSFTKAYVVAPSETFYIRVNDSPGAFANNTQDEISPMTYSIGLAVLQSGGTCGSQFAYDEDLDWVASVDVHGDDADGVLATSSLVTGQWYVIQVVSGAWQNDGAAPDRYDMEYYNGPSEFTNTSIPYADLANGSSNTYCQSEDGKTSYIQAAGADLFLRVNDTAFTSNTGVLHVNVFTATFTRSVSTCEMQFNKESLVSSGSVNANQENGKVFAFALGSSTISYSGALKPGAWYYLETKGGPWQWKGSAHQASAIAYDMAVSEDGSTWTPLAEWARAGCVIEIDGLGHQGAYFQIPEVADVEWSLRVNDDASWGNNAGTMEWDLYGASDLGVVPQDSCDFIYDQDHPANGGWVDAKKSEGEWMPIYADHIYAVKILGSQYYWSETEGGPQLRDVEISNDDGATWSAFPEGFAGTLCFMENGQDTTVFIKAGQGQTWRLRVNSDSFSDNYGGMGYRIFEANAGDTLDPWTQCFDGNVANLINSLAYIPVRDENGTYINGTDILVGGAERLILQPSETYKLQIEEGPWNSGSADSYDADISADNGETWYAIDDKDNPNIICGDTDFIGHHKSVYFTVQAGQSWKIRVGDTPGEFLNNTGDLAYSLYSMSGADVPTVDVTIPMTIVNNVCSAPIVRPGAPSLWEPSGWVPYLSNWVNYSRLGIQKYFAWCTPHTNIIMSLLDLLKGKEPFASIVEMLGMVQNVKIEINSYSWNSDGTDYSILDKSPAASFKMFTDHAYAPIQNDNPWETGFVDIASFENFSMPTSYYSCQEYLAPQAGTYLAQGTCYASAVMLMTGASFWIQLILDIGIGILALKSFRKTILDTVEMATGVALVDKML